MGPVQDAIRETVHEGDVMYTPSASQPFRVSRINLEGVVLELGRHGAPTLLPWYCLEGVPGFLRGHGDVRIGGSGKAIRIAPNTFDGYLKEYMGRLTASCVAAVLEKAGVVEIQRTRPASIRLSSRFSENDCAQLK
jgi:hypothetical protein